MVDELRTRRARGSSMSKSVSRVAFLLLVVCCEHGVLSYSSSSSVALPSWSDLASILGVEADGGDDRNGDVDSALDPAEPAYRSDRPTLFRERHGWCPYSERVWLALEASTTYYDTVRIDNTGPGAKPSYWSGTTPQMRWEDGRKQGESMDLVREVDERYGNGALYAPSNVLDRVAAWRDVFPRARPSSRAAFLFGYGGEPLPKTEFERVLRDTDDLLSDSDSDGGPFFCGADFSAADVAWAPFLERYAAQLPCLHDDLRPRSDEYPHLLRWYEAMDNVPAYACRVKGDASSWRKVLGMAGYGNMGNVPDEVFGRMESLRSEERRRGLSGEENGRRQRLWDDYRSGGGRSHLASTPAAEAAAVVVRNRDAVVADARSRCRFDKKWAARLSSVLTDDDDDEVDGVLRALACCLVEGEGSAIVLPAFLLEDPVLRSQVGTLASFLDERMCVPRDMGGMSADAIRQVAYQFDDEL